jgi:DNA-binding NtrC family response regulator
VRIPPLRERTEEIPVLAQHLLERHCGSRKPPALSAAFLDAVVASGLPGNMRELESLIFGALVRAGRAEELLPEHLPVPGRSRAEAGAIAESRGRTGRTGHPTGPAAGRPRDADPVPSYENMERRYILSVLELTEGNKKEAAELMRIPRTTLNARIKKLGIDPSA